MQPRGLCKWTGGPVYVYETDCIVNGKINVDSKCMQFLQKDVHLKRWPSSSVFGAVTHIKTGSSCGQQLILVCGVFGLWKNIEMAVKTSINAACIRIFPVYYFSCIYFVYKKTMHILFTFQLNVFSDKEHVCNMYIYPSYRDPDIMIHVVLWGPWCTSDVQGAALVREKKN